MRPHSDTMNYEQFIHTQRTGVFFVSYLPYIRLSSFLHVHDDFPRLRCPTHHTHLGQQHQARLVQLGSLQQRQSGPDGLKDQAKRKASNWKGNLRQQGLNMSSKCGFSIVYIVPNQRFDCSRNQNLQLMFYSYTVVGVMCSKC